VPVPVLGPTIGVLPACPLLATLVPVVLVPAVLVPAVLVPAVLVAGL
jgi:hypothetical protein